MNENIEKTIEEFSEFTPSQKSRLTFKEDVYDTLLNFLQSYVQQSIAKSDLEERLDSDLLDALNNTNPEEQLSNFEKIKLKEILSKEKTDSKGNLVKALIEGTKNIDSNKKKTDEEIETKKIGKDINQKDIDEALGILKTLSKFQKELEKTESSAQELEKK